MGIVYFAEKSNGECASIKILHPKFTQDRELVMRFLQEARLVQKLDHPNIIKLYNYGFDKDLGYFLTFEYLQGETLLQRSAHQTPLSPRFAADLVFQMLGGLSVAHTMNVIHCDLKPSNVFLSGFPSDPQVKLLDFGIAKSVAKDNVSITKTGVLLGTPEYMAPEQSFGRKQIDGRTDLYAVGVILFELLTGRRPFLARNASEMLVKHYRERPPIPSALLPGLPHEMDELILACLEKEPRHRPQSAQELARWLRALYHLLPETPQRQLPKTQDTEVMSGP
jgi:serine/threonine-protein kinase